MQDLSKRPVIATIDNLRLWRADNWMPYAKVSNLICLRICLDQLLITSHSKILESLNMNGKIKGVYKEDVLVLLVSGHLQDVRKIKFQIKTNTVEVLNKLNKHFPVTNYNHSSSNICNMKYRTIDEMFKKTMEKAGIENIKIALPPVYPDFVKMCLLDPNFPLLVLETQKILGRGIIED